MKNLNDGRPLMRHAMNSVRSLIFGANLLLCVTTSASGQKLSDLPVNSRVRLVLVDSLRQGPLFPPRQIVVGRLVRSTADSVTLRLMGSSEFSVARTGVRDVRVSRGVSPVRSALALGITLGALSAWLVHEDGADGRYHQTHDTMVAGGIAFGAGALIGTVSPSEYWHRVKK